MSKGRLQKYAGELDAAQIAAGMNAARRNARRLADDATLLINAGRYATAASLAILSIEESGKVSILRGLAMVSTKEGRKRVWKDYRSHRSKNTGWILPNLVSKGARDLEALRPATDPTGEHTAILDQVKQLAIYTDCVGSANWSEPEKIIDESLAKSLVQIADLFASTKTISVKEIELWTEHMRPIYGRPLDWMKTALLNRHAAMKEHGLSEDGDIPFEAFIRGGRKGKTDL